MSEFEITREEVILVVTIIIMGFVFSTREWILFLDRLNPFVGLLVYYAILYVCLYALSKGGLIIWKFKIKNVVQVFGCLLITFAFFVIVDWESMYIAIVTGKSTNISNVYLQAEDGAVWYLWSFLTSNVEALRILTYVVTPAILTFIGVLLVKKAEIFGR